MCFHNSMSAKAAKLAARYGRKSDVIEIVQDILDEQYHVNAFNYPRYPIITSSDEIQVFNWGLIPRWVKTETDAEDIRKYTLNARADTIFEKPSYRESIRKRRCIVPSTGYFEWRHSGRNRIPYFIYLKDEPIFSMAGIYDTWLDKETGKEYSTFSLITTDANRLTAYIHNSKRRMPAIQSGRRNMARPRPEPARNRLPAETVRCRRHGRLCGAERLHKKGADGRNHSGTCLRALYE